MNEDWKSRAEKAEKQLAAIYELALSEDGLADFDAESIRGAWECYCPIDELERVQRQCTAMREALRQSNDLLRDIRLCDDDEGKIASQIINNNDAIASAEAIRLQPSR